MIGSAPGVCHPLRSLNILIPLTSQAPNNHVTPDQPPRAGSDVAAGSVWITSSLTSGAGPGEKRALRLGSRTSLIHRPGSKLFFVCAYDTGSASPVKKSTFLASLVTTVAAAPKLHEGPQGQMGGRWLGGRWLEAQVHTVKTSPGALRGSSPAGPGMESSQQTAPTSPT